MARAHPAAPASCSPLPACFRCGTGAFRPLFVGVEALPSRLLHSPESAASSLSAGARTRATASCSRASRLKGRWRVSWSSTPARSSRSTTACSTCDVVSSAFLFRRTRVRQWDALRVATMFPGAPLWTLSLRLADSRQTFKFVDALEPLSVILVHGEKTEMRRLRNGLANRYKTNEVRHLDVFCGPLSASVSPLPCCCSASRCIRLRTTLAS